MSLTIKIRPIEVDDAPAANAMRRMDGVMENIGSVISERIIDSQRFIENLNEYDHVIVAEILDQPGPGRKTFVGMARLHVEKKPRSRHCATIGIMVHANYQNQGIGRILMNALLDLADNYLKLVRIELEVYTDNQAAVHLYESLGFQIEGTRKFAAIRNGNYADFYLMARYRVN